MTIPPANIEQTTTIAKANDVGIFLFIYNILQQYEKIQKWKTSISLCYQQQRVELTALPD